MVIPVGGWVSKDAASISTVAVLLDETAACGRCVGVNLVK